MRKNRIYMNRFRYFTLLAFCLFNVSVYGVIHKVSSLEKISNLLTTMPLDMNCLFVFDVDSTLISYDQKGAPHCVESITERFVQ